MINNRNIAIITFVLLFAFMQILYPVPSPVPTNQLMLILGSILVLSRGMGGDSKIHWPSVLFMGALVLSIVTNNIPEFFKPWQRLLQFTFLMVAASPMLHNPFVERSRRQMGIGVIWACAAVSVLSFVAYLTGQGAYISGIIQGYMGITSHPNFLGMFSIVAMVWFASLFFRSTNMRERGIWAGCWAGCLIVVLLSASRSSAACGLLGTLAVVYLRFRKDAGKMFTAGIVASLLFIAALPYLMPYMETMMQKGISVDEEESDELVAATRGSIWELRYLEIAESPWVGVGTYSCDINLPYADVFYDATNGSIEQGSSYLGLMAQTGWIGFIAFLLICVPIIWKTYRYATRENTPYAQLMLALIIPIAVHMVVEGYAITAGAVQCVVLWFVIGMAHQCHKVADYPVFWEEEDPITPDEYVEWRENQ